MNDLLQLRGRFEQKARPSSTPLPSLPSNAIVYSDHMRKLLRDLETLCEFWTSEKLIKGALISVQYIDVIAKSRRISGFFSKGTIKSNQSVVGARFADEEKRKHVITHYISLALLQDSVNKLRESIYVIEKYFNGSITDTMVKNIAKNELKYDTKIIKKTNFLNIVVDCHYVEKFFVSNNTEEYSNNSIITIFKTDNTMSILDSIGINVMPSRIMDDTTLLLTPDQLSKMHKRAPYLIAMATTDISTLVKEDFTEVDNSNIVTIPPPQHEPVIGVIDTMFDESVYFTEWVKFEKQIPDDIELNQEDFFHGTSVSSIIVDGPNINPNLDDGCGRFRVRHFGVATSGQFSSFSILRSIDEIVKSNKDIKVWNLSLGSTKEINQNFISPEAAILDRIQCENDVIFVIAGTNKLNNDTSEKYIGAPADSINSLVVNAVDYDNNPATYSRKGPVLSFFNKPDISYYGGDKHQKMRVCSNTGAAIVAGTSFAAPWISRKMAYLINILGLSREVAKALLIDSASGWSKQENPSNLIGYGVVPINIENVVKSQDDEIKFAISGISEKYDTFNYSLPVPTHKNKYPYIAKATLCYFPMCSRNQGVDYTNTELDIHFGRLNGKKIETINDNNQGEDGSYIYEGNARKFYRKWDNIKHIQEYTKKRHMGKKIYENQLWGISVRTTERLEDKYGVGLNFGIVITLKEINSINRIDDFISQCFLKNWFVNRVDVVNQVDIYNIAEAEIEFDNE